MSKVREPKVTVLYNKKNITAVVSQYLISLKYKDAVEGKSDEVQLELSNVSGVWLDEWYPELGDTLTVSIGFDSDLMYAGDFDIDENEIKVAPDTITIKGIAAGVKDSTRTKRGDSHEQKTLAQIAQKVADRYNYTIVGNIVDTGQISRVTQEMTTDLNFLKCLSKEYGHVFSVRKGVMTFSSIYELEALAAATSIGRAEMLKGTILKDKSYDTYKKVHHAHFDIAGKRVIETEFEFPVVTNSDGFSYNAIVKSDTKEVRSRVDNEKQSQLKAVAALHSSNSKQQEGTLVTNGNPYILSGNNITIEEMGKLSGLYHVTAAEHLIIIARGWTTSAEVKRVGFIDIAKTKRKKPKKIKPITVKIVK